MAPSRNSGAFSDTTRRNFLSGAAAAIAAAAATGETVGRETGVDYTDRVVELWRNWLTAHRLRVEACRRQQKLETKLLQQFGSFPRAKISVRGDGGFLFAYSSKEINGLLPDSIQAETRRKARDELLARRGEWRSADAHIGYSRMKRVEDGFAEIEESLAKELWVTEPRSTAGVAAKLHSILETEDPGSELKEKPWPELRSVLADLVQICAEPGKPTLG